MSIKSETIPNLEKKKNIIKDRIIEKAKKGNNKALQNLYQNYSKAMFNICVRMSNTIEDAEDLLQEAFTDAFMKLDSYLYESSFGSWLKRIVINKCINSLNKKDIELILSDNENDIVCTEETDYSDIELKVEHINKGIMALPNGYKIICSLYLLEGYDHKEIAQIMNISESTSKSQYMRGKKKLKEILLNYA